MRTAVPLLLVVLTNLTWAAGPKTMPETWRRALTPAQLDKFFGLVEQDLRGRKVTPAWEGDSLVIRERAGLQIGLDNLLQRCVTAPAESEWPVVIKDHFDILFRTMEQRDAVAKEMQAWEKAEPRLAVRIYPMEILSPEQRESLVTRTDLEGTVSIVVVDLPETVYFVDRENGKAWKKTDAELFDVALKNLRKMPHPAPREMKSRDGGGPTLIGVAGDDVFVASHVLTVLPDGHFVGKGGTLVAVPNRHLFLLHPMNDASAATAAAPMIRIALQQEAKGPGSISPALFWFHDGKFEKVAYDLAADGSIKLNPSQDLQKAMGDLPAATAKP